MHNLLYNISMVLSTKDKILRPSRPHKGVNNND